MSRSEPNLLLALTQSFFLNYLQSTRGASSHTMRAYRDALKLFFLFLAGHKRKAIADLDLDDIQAEAVLKFLDHIESKRGNSAVTRNCRLAAIRSFTQHLLQHDVTRAGQYGRILAIGTKRAIHRAVAYLEPEEARAVIGAVDTSSPGGRRDHATHQGRRRLPAAEICPPCRKEELGTTASPRDSAHASTQLRGRPSTSGRRRDGDSRLPWPRVGQHNKPVHYYEPANETPSARRILEASWPCSNCYPEVASLAEDARLSQNPVTLSGASNALDALPAASHITFARPLWITAESG